MVVSGRIFLRSSAEYEISTTIGRIGHRMQKGSFLVKNSAGVELVMTAHRLSHRLCRLLSSRQDAFRSLLLNVQHPHVQPIHDMHFNPDTALVLIFRKYNEKGSLRDYIYGCKPKQDFLRKYPSLPSLPSTRAAMASCASGWAPRLHGPPASHDCMASRLHGCILHGWPISGLHGCMAFCLHGLLPHMVVWPPASMAVWPSWLHGLLPPWLPWASCFHCCMGLLPPWLHAPESIAACMAALPRAFMAHGCQGLLPPGCT